MEHAALGSDAPLALALLLEGHGKLIGRCIVDQQSDWRANASTGTQKFLFKRYRLANDVFDFFYFICAHLLLPQLSILC